MSSSVGRNSLIMASGTAASRVTGQIRTILLAWALGTTGYAANAYQAGSMIPQVIYTLVSGGIFNAVLVPQIVRTLKSKDAETKLNKLITLAITLLLGVTLLMAVATPLLTKLYVNGSAETMALATSFTLWCMPQIFFYGLYTVIGQILAAKDHFVTYAWSSVGANIISCIGFGAFIAMFGRATERPLDFWTPTKIALTAGTWTLGVAFQALVLFIPLTRIGLKYRPKFGVHGIGLRSMGPVAAWSLGIVGVDQIVNIIVTRVATSAPFKASEQLHMSQLDVAGNASYQNAYTIYMLPYSLIAGVISAVLFIIVGIKTSTSVTLPDVIDPAYAKTLVMLVIPVIMIILMLRGWNLISTLIVCDLVGFVLCLVFGFLDVPTLFSATGPIGAGLTGMLNVICFSFFMFALLEMLKRSGVFDMLLEKLNNASKTPRQAELVTILLSVIGSVAIGAASISILFVGPVVRKLLQTHNIERTRGSNLMDGIATGLAGIVPYNPVGLNAVSLAIASGVVSESFSFLDYVPYNFHSWLLILLFLLSAITGIGRHFEKGTAAAPETPAAEEK